MKSINSMINALFLITFFIILNLTLFLLLPIEIYSNEIIKTSDIPVNREYLRHDETLSFDEIAFKFSNIKVLYEIPDDRDLGLGIDYINFFDVYGNLLSKIDIGSQDSNYWLGEGWYDNENYGNQTMCWSNYRATKSVIYFPIPLNTSAMQVFCLTPNLQITTEIFANGKKLGDFILSAVSGWQKQTFTFNEPIYRFVEYRLLSGGPLSISQINWINMDGDFVSATPTVCFLTQIGQSALFPLQIPSNIGDFSITFNNPVSATTTIQISFNNASSVLLEIKENSNYVISEEPNALERQADRKLQINGWGENFNRRYFGRIIWYPNHEYPIVDSNGDTVSYTLHKTCINAQVQFFLPHSLSFSDYPYLSIKIKASKDLIYFIRPDGYTANGKNVALWHETAITDDRYGTDEWEILTFNLKNLVYEANTNGVSISSIVIPFLNPTSIGSGTIILDWIRVHKGFLPNKIDMQIKETDFDDHLDNDGDGLLDHEDEDDFITTKMKKRFDGKQILVHYHPWYGPPISCWGAEQRNYSNSGQLAIKTGVIFDPNTFDTQFPGKRNIATPYYPLNFLDYPNYEPPLNRQYRYDLYGGVEKIDNLDFDYMRKEVTLAQQYGIDGYVMDWSGKGNVEPEIHTALAAALEQKKRFWMSILYDGYFRNPSAGNMIEKPDYRMALDFQFFYSDFSIHPCWLLFDFRPVIMAFNSSSVTLNKWKRVEDIFLNPEKNSYDGIINTPFKLSGFRNKITFKFYKEEQPNPINGDARHLSVVFNYIRCLNLEFKEVSFLDIGTAGARPHLLYGWSGNENWGSDIRADTCVWAEGIKKEAALEMEIPDNARYLEIECGSYPLDNFMTIQINDGLSLKVPVPKNISNFLFILDEIQDLPSLTETEEKKRSFALFLDNKEAAKYFDGFASYSPYLENNDPYLNSHHVSISDSFVPQPTILTVGCGYDDRKIRKPGGFVDRENGALYRRQWETALENEPDMVLINTWNEWFEGTNIAPTVEFGYQYLDLTLTYSLIFKGNISVSDKPSKLGLIFHRYNIQNKDSCEISFSAKEIGIITFHKLPITLVDLKQWQILKDDQPYSGFQFDADKQTLIINTQKSDAIYSIRKEIINPSKILDWQINQ